MSLADIYQSMPTDQTEQDSLFGQIARTAWSPIQFLLQTLDKPGRAARGLLGGRPDELANLIPFSDSIGLTDPEHSLSGRDLLRQAGVAGEDDNWGNFLAGLGVDIATDPLNFLTFGTKAALTPAGKIAKMTTGLAENAPARIAAGQAGIMGVRSPWFYDMLAPHMGLPTGSAPIRLPSAIENTLAAAPGQGVDWMTRNVPGVAKARSMFQYGTGVSAHPDVVNAFGDVFPAAEKEAIAKAAPYGMDLMAGHHELRDLLEQRGITDSGDMANRLVRNAIVGADPQFSGIGPIAPDLLNMAEQAAVPYRAGQDALLDLERSLGLDITPHNSTYGHGYYHLRTGENGLSRTGPLKARVIPEELLAGGPDQLDRYVNPQMAGYAHDPIPVGMNPDQWDRYLDKRRAGVADQIAADAMAGRDKHYVQSNTPIPESLTDESIRTKSRGLAEHLSDLPPERVAKGRYYDADPISSFFESGESAASKAATAKGTLETLKSAAQPRTAIAKNPGEWMTVDEAMTELGLISQDAGPHMHGQPTMVDAGGKKTLHDMFTGKTGPASKTDITNVLGDKAVPVDLVDALKKEFEPLGRPPAHGWGAVVDKVTSATRAAFTTPWLPFHTRNVWEGGLQQGLAGSFDPKEWANHVKYKLGLLDDPKLISEMQQFHNEGFNYKAFGRGQAFDQLGRSAVNDANATINPLVSQTGGSAKDAVMDYLMEKFSPSAVKARGESYLGNPLRIFTNPEESAILQQGNAIHRDIDDLLRGSQFTTLRRQGYSPQAAADVVTASQLDYSKLTPTERLLRQNIPFYSFSKQNLARLAGQMQDPGALVSLLRMGGSARQDQAIPGYVSPGAAIPVPGAEEGSQRYISGMSLPFEDELLGSLTSLATGRVSEAARRGLSMADPLTKLLATLGTGTQIFSGRPLEDVKPSSIASLGGLLPAPAANVLSEVLGATPAGRVMSTVNTAVNGRDQDMLLRLLTGVKTTDVDTEMARNLMAKDALEKALKGTGMVGTSTNIYPKEEFKDPANQPDELRKLLEALKVLQQQSKAARDAKAFQLSIP